MISYFQVWKGEDQTRVEMNGDAPVHHPCLKQ
jgi:hypothetical protein